MKYEISKFPLTPKIFGVNITNTQHVQSFFFAFYPELRSVKIRFTKSRSFLGSDFEIFVFETENILGVRDDNVIFFEKFLESYSSPCIFLESYSSPCIFYEDDNLIKFLKKLLKVGGSA
jgi:hypothetical protein